MSGEPGCGPSVSPPSQPDLPSSDINLPGPRFVVHSWIHIIILNKIKTNCSKNDFSNVVAADSQHASPQNEEMVCWFLNCIWPLENRIS